MTALDELIVGLQTARTSVFRLEAHQTYPDDELWQAHQRGQRWQDSDDLAWWCRLVAANRARGVPMTRVRTVAEPWTPYTRWEIEQHYPHNLRAGEDIRLLHADLPDVPDASGVAAAHEDFWLVDDENAWWLRYDEAGPMTVAPVPPASVPSLRAVRDQTLAAAAPLSPATS